MKNGSRLLSRRRQAPRPPAGYEDHLARADAAELLGFSSEFKVRQLEKQGVLRPVRGRMGQAWYPRGQVLAVRAALASPAPSVTSPRPGGEPLGPLQARWSDGALIGHLRAPVPDEAGGPPRPRTVADLVADTGIGIARAERIYRFWLAHDVHPVAGRVRQARATRGRSPSPLAPAGRDGQAGPSTERRGRARVERDALIRQLRHADPAARAAAFEGLKKGRPSTDVT